MNTNRHLNDVFARRARATHASRHSDEDEMDEEGEDTAAVIENTDNSDVVEEVVRTSPSRQQQPRNATSASSTTTLMDMLMRGAANSTTTTSTIVAGSGVNNSNISPAVLEYMRVSQSPKSSSSSSSQQQIQQPESVPLEDVYHARYSERIARIASKIEYREQGAYDNDYDDLGDDDLGDDGGGDDVAANEEDEDDAMLRELFGEDEASHPSLSRPSSGTSAPQRKKRRQSGSRLSANREECFLCAYGDRFHDGIRAPHIARLVQIIDKFYGRMSNYELANAVHLYYKHNIYREGEGMHMLEASVVLEHFEGRHSLAALNFIVESIRDYEQVKFIAKGCLCKADGSMDHRAFAIFDKAQTKLEKLYTMNIEKMNFNNGQTTEDLNGKGAYFNLMPMFSQKEEHHRRLKRKADAIESATSTFHL